MKTNLKLLAVAILATINLQLATSFAQGTLTPPGAPAASMKSLDQIEARTPISSVPYTITNPGSYYLTANLTVSSGNAISIATNGVTLDLNGFTLRSTDAANSGNAVNLAGGLHNLTILNGFIEGGVTNNGSGYFGPGFAQGIFSLGTDPVNTRVSGVAVGGCKFNGIYVHLNLSALVENCTVRTVGSAGIIGNIVKNCSATDCGGTAIYCNQASDCKGESTDGNPGVDAQATALNCHGSSISGTGLYAADSAQNCYGISSSGVGLVTMVANCVGSRFGGTAISATVANGCYAASGTNIITYKYNMP